MELIIRFTTSDFKEDTFIYHLRDNLYVSIYVEDPKRTDHITFYCSYNEGDKSTTPINPVGYDKDQLLKDLKESVRMNFDSVKIKSILDKWLGLQKRISKMKKIINRGISNKL